MRIGIDIDDTIADSYESFFAYAQYYTVNELKREIKVDSEYVAKHHSYIKAMHGWSEEEENNFWRKYFSLIVPQIKPYTFAVETLKKLKEDGHEIIIITARYQEREFDVEKATIEWLDKNEIPFDDIVFNAEDKSKVALDREIDIFIDDSFKNCQDVANVGIRSFIMNTRTNKGLESPNITRVYSWSDIYSKINK